MHSDFLAIWICISSMSRHAQSCFHACPQDVVHNDDQMEITLTMTLDPDLHLRFFDAATYVTWKRGLELLLTLLFAPGVKQNKVKSTRLQ